jgi:hypothetical protein
MGSVQGYTVARVAMTRIMSDLYRLVCKCGSLELLRQERGRTRQYGNEAILNTSRKKFKSVDLQLRIKMDVVLRFLQRIFKIKKTMVNSSIKELCYCNYSG